jgi:hypothetical protein
MVLATAAPGRLDELITWYDDHLARMARVPSIRSCTRYEPAAVDRTCPHDFVTIYEIGTDDLERALAEIATARAAMPDLVATIEPPTVWLLSASAPRTNHEGSP